MFWLIVEYNSYGQYFLLGVLVTTLANFIPWKFVSYKLRFVFIKKKMTIQLNIGNITIIRFNLNRFHKSFRPNLNTIHSFILIQDEMIKIMSYLVTFSGLKTNFVGTTCIHEIFDLLD